MSDDRSERSDGKIVKMEIDYSATVDTGKKVWNATVVKRFNSSIRCVILGVWKEL